MTPDVRRVWRWDLVTTVSKQACFERTRRECHPITVRRCHVPLLPSLGSPRCSLPAPCHRLHPSTLGPVSSYSRIPAPSPAWQRGPAAPRLLQDCPAPSGIPSLPSPLPPLPSTSHADTKAGPDDAQGLWQPCPELGAATASFPFPTVPPLELGWDSQCIRGDKKPPHEPGLPQTPVLAAHGSPGKPLTTANHGRGVPKQ